MFKFNFYISVAQYEQLVRLSQESGKSIAALIREAVDLYIKRIERAKSKEITPSLTPTADTKDDELL